MKYLKLFEEQSRIKQPQIGDYVICDEDIPHTVDLGINIFLSQNIGQLIKIRVGGFGTTYVVQYENTPKNIQDYFQFDDEISNCRDMDRDEIKHFSKNKGELEIFLAVTKYNL